MTTDPETVLPDPALVRQAAVAAVEAATDGWLRLTYVLYFERETLVRALFWIEDATGRRKARHPQSGVPLLTLREDMIEKGQPGWLRADLVVSRDSEDGPITYNVDFSYEVGELPE